MERDNPLDGLNDDELLMLFKSVEAPAPSRDFAARTMRAVVRAPLPAGRKALRDPLVSMFGWAAVIAAVAFMVLAIGLSQPIVAAGFSRLITRGVGTGVWLMQFWETGLRVLDVLTTTGLAVSRAAATAEGTTGLVLTAVVGALSLSTLHRMLISEGEDSQWQELS
jgi:xanthine/uracil permease